MLTNAFVNQPTEPTESALAAALGPAHPLWVKLVGNLFDSGHIDGQEWNSYSPKAGWSLRLKRGQRNIVYLSPGAGGFMASLALGDKALKVARERGLSPAVLKLLKAARKYAEGTAVRIEVKKASDLVSVERLVAAKVANEQALFCK